jgi:hypothetical protein
MCSCTVTCGGRSLDVLRVALVEPVEPEGAVLVDVVAAEMVVAVVIDGAVDGGVEGVVEEAVDGIVEEVVMTGEGGLEVAGGGCGCKNGLISWDEGVEEGGGGLASEVGAAALMKGLLAANMGGSDKGDKTDGDENVGAAAV